jgi:hypothetical protein
MTAKYAKRPRVARHNGVISSGKLRPLMLPHGSRAGIRRREMPQGADADLASGIDLPGKRSAGQQQTEHLRPRGSRRRLPTKRCANRASTERLSRTRARWRTPANRIEPRASGVGRTKAGRRRHPRMYGTSRPVPADQPFRSIVDFGAMAPVETKRPTGLTERDLVTAIRASRPPAGPSWCSWTHMDALPGLREAEGP